MILFSQAPQSFVPLALLRVLDGLYEFSRCSRRDTGKRFPSLLVFRVAATPTADDLVVSAAEVVIVVLVKVEMVHS